MTAVEGREKGHGYRGKVALFGPGSPAAMDDHAASPASRVHLTPKDASTSEEV